MEQSQTSPLDLAHALPAAELYTSEPIYYMSLAATDNLLSLQPASQTGVVVIHGGKGRMLPSKC